MQNKLLAQYHISYMSNSQETQSFNGGLLLAHGRRQCVVFVELFLFEFHSFILISFFLPSI